MSRTSTRVSIRTEYPDHPINCPVEDRATNSDCGSKVRWLWFDTEEDAQACCKWARVEAEIKQRQGYDSGYCTPGTYVKTDKGYKVCIL